MVQSIHSGIHHFRSTKHQSNQGPVSQRCSTSSTLLLRSAEAEEQPGNVLYQYEPGHEPQYRARRAQLVRRVGVGWRLRFGQVDGTEDEKDHADGADRVDLNLDEQEPAGLFRGGCGGGGGLEEVVVEFVQDA